jgi:hypothetical protein
MKATKYHTTSLDFLCEKERGLTAANNENRVLSWACRTFPSTPPYLKRYFNWSHPRLAFDPTPLSSRGGRKPANVRPEFRPWGFYLAIFFGIQGQHNPASPISVWLECMGKKLAQGLLKAASDRRHNLSFGSRCFSVAWPVASTATTYSTPADEAWPNRQSYGCFCIPANLANSTINNGQPAYSISQADPAD